MTRLNRERTHPGEMFRKDILPALGLDFDQAARKSGLSADRFRAFLKGADLDEAEARKLEEAFCVKARLILNMQKTPRVLRFS